MLNVLKNLQLKKTSGRFYAPLSTDVLQHIDANWYDAGDPSALRADDRSGNGNYALQDVDYSVVDAGIADRGVSWNDGTDYVDLGRPDWLDRMRPTLDEFTVCLVNQPVGSGVKYAIGLADSFTDETANIVVYFNDPSLVVKIGGSARTFDSVAPNNGVYSLVITCTNLKFYVYLNGTLLDPSGDSINENIITASNLYINGRTDGESSNFQGATWDVEFYAGYTDDGDCSGLELLESFTLDDPAGTTTITGVNGTTGTVADGTPGGFFGTKGIAKKITLNNTALTGPTGYPADGVALTKAEIGALHDGSVMFATPGDGAGNFRFIVYPDGTVLTDDQKATLNAYTRNT